MRTGHRWIVERSRYQPAPDAKIARRAFAEPRTQKNAPRITAARCSIRRRHRSGGVAMAALSYLIGQYTSN
ncbi:hypothetical protein [Lysobacter sp. CA199]|uniref:hypothetical protein n=1 Tax=Lysobacter sp. CA199 TaxID=3455608 RepID=UPI003F8CFEDD